jgi:hypothetical protein
VASVWVSKPGEPKERKLCGGLSPEAAFLRAGAFAQQWAAQNGGSYCSHGLAICLTRRDKGPGGMLWIEVMSPPSAEEPGDKHVAKKAD